MDVTVVCPLADSYVASAAREARSVAELAATKKEDTYSGLAAEYIFQPIAVETLGPINGSASDFSHFWRRKLAITPATSERQLFGLDAIAYSLIATWLAGWLSVTAGIVSKRLNLS